MQFLAFGECIADAQIAMIGNANDVTGKRFLCGFAVLGQKKLRIVDGHLLARAHMEKLDAALEVPRGQPHKCNSVAVFGVHIGLDFEDKAHHIILGRLDFAFCGGLGARRGRHLRQALQ